MLLLACHVSCIVHRLIEELRLPRSYFVVLRFAHLRPIEKHCRDTSTYPITFPWWLPTLSKSFSIQTNRNVWVEPSADLRQLCFIDGIPILIGWVFDAYFSFISWVLSLSLSVGAWCGSSSMYSFVVDLVLLTIRTHFFSLAVTPHPFLCVVNYKHPISYIWLSVLNWI